MNIILQTETAVVLYAGEALALTEAGATNGDWFDDKSTTANCTLVEGVELPAAWCGQHYTYIDGVWGLTAQGTAAQAAQLATASADLVLQIDADTDAIYQQVIGNRAAEYTVAEAEALAYADAGYTGTVPASVASWATAKGWAAQAAADDIIATATAWRTNSATSRSSRWRRIAPASKREISSRSPTSRERRWPCRTAVCR